MTIRNLMAKATPAVELLYDKEAVIKRYEEIEKPNGADGMTWVEKHTDVPCRLSTVGSTLNNTTQDGANTIQYDVKLFLSSNYDVLSGDKMIIDSIEYESAKEPYVYVSHQEVFLVRKGYA
ncbi:hypothetical protein ACSVDA_15485 [Cytobacillus sp. Hm23]